MQLRRPPRDPKDPPAIRTESAFVAELAASLAGAADSAQRAHLLDAFWDEAARAGTPLAEPAPAGSPDGTVAMTFLYRMPLEDWTGDVLVLANKLTPAGLPEHARMQRLAGTDVLHVSYLVSSAWRGTYRIAVLDELPAEPAADGPTGTDLAAAARRRWAGMIEHSRHDALNKDRTNLGDGNDWSLASMPDAPAQPWRTPGALPAPPLARIELRSAAFGTPRTCWMHRTQPQERPRALVVLLDGEIWSEHVPIAPAVDHLDAAGLLAPTVILAVSAGDVPQRWRELGDPDPAMQSFLRTDVMEWFEQTWGGAPEHCIVAGQSLGAIAALRAFGADESPYDAVVAHSPSLWIDDDAPIQELAALLARTRSRTAPSSAARSHIGAPRIQLGVGCDEWILFPRAHTLAQRLADADVNAQLHVWAGGHDIPCWTDGLASTLPQLIGDGIEHHVGAAP